MSIPRWEMAQEHYFECLDNEIARAEYYNETVNFNQLCEIIDNLDNNK